MKRILSLILTLALVLSLGTAAFAAESGFSDVDSGAWYAEAVEYCKENGLMQGVSATSFAPNNQMTRAELVTALYRRAGSPAVSGSDSFTDTADGQWYTDSVLWASQNGIVGGYSSTQFGTNDPVTREQIVTILYRIAGEPEVQEAEAFADQDSISDYAVSAVAWARVNGVINGKGDNRFDPKGNATRAEAATVLMNEAKRTDPTPTPTPAPSGSKVLVAYYSATGSTENVANYIAEELNADTFEMVPVNQYTSADLNWTNSSSRVNAEHDDESKRDIELVKTTPDNWEDYDVVLVGYPIWWGIAAWPVNNFVKDNDFTGKTVIPFCTSSSSGLGQSGTLLAEMAGEGDWQTGQRFQSSASQSTVVNWVKGLDLPTTPTEQEGKTLIVYFSMPDNVDDSTVTINGQVLGNNQYMAQVIQETIGGDIFRIEPVTPYPTNHSTLVDQASREQSENARPAIKGTIENFDQYDTVFVGYPIWWSDMPMILYTFFDTYDLSGKTLIPFGTHGGSGWAGTPATIARLEPNANILEGLSISRDVIEGAHDQIVNWVNGLGI